MLGPVVRNVVSRFGFQVGLARSRRGGRRGVHLIRQATQTCRPGKLAWVYWTAVCQRRRLSLQRPFHGASRRRSRKLQRSRPRGHQGALNPFDLERMNSVAPPRQSLARMEQG